jgi:hypothetical protein
MTDYSVTVTIRTDGPATVGTAGRVAGTDGVATLDRRHGRIVATLRCRADSLLAAATDALEKVTAGEPGEVVAIEVLTEEEAGRRLTERVRAATDGSEEPT